MITVSSIAKTRKIIARARNAGKTIGFVPTMGALHAGHIALVKKAKKECDFTAVSIFVNPAQFGPNEDYRKYPRPFQSDTAILAKEKVDLLFYPSPNEMYPQGFSTFIEENFLSKVMCGRSRPGHFKGVCTVVAKLFNIITPDIAYFGHKDYQQAKIIEKIAKDLNFAVKIAVLPTIREKDGLAMSSRNAYLNSEQRKNATCLYSALMLAKLLIEKGERSPGKIINEIKKIINLTPQARLDYVIIAGAQTLRELKIIEGKVLIALAVFIANTRLIDNLVLDVKK
jgi:pantoate--beta-alanine ligase